MCKTGQDDVVDGIPHHPVSWSWQQSQPALGETRGPGQGSLAVLPRPALSQEGFGFGLHMVLRSGEGILGAAGRQMSGRTRMRFW